MTERIRELTFKAGAKLYSVPPSRQITGVTMSFESVEKFAELIIRDCVEKIETYQIPVGNSAVGEMACELTYTSLKELRDDIKHHFGIKGE